MNIILASKSPRRVEILNLAQIVHQSIPSNKEEKIVAGCSPEQVVTMLAVQKASDIAQNHFHDVVIGADTIVVIDQNILGKPHTEKEAISMLQQLSGRTHRVMTGVCVINQTTKDVFVETTEVTFSPLSQAEIINYIHTEQVYDKAGSYAVQGSGCKYIEKIQGDFYNVMGLPICKLYQLLNRRQYL